jgi:hypothetical protein
VTTITRVVGLHNENPESNTDKVWAGVVLHNEESNRYQFVSLYGRRGAALRPTPQPEESNFAALDRFNRARRDKLAHGYETVDWTQARFGMLAGIRSLGMFSDDLQQQYREAIGQRSPNQFRQDNAAERQRIRQEERAEDARRQRLHEIEQEQRRREQSRRIATDIERSRDPQPTPAPEPTPAPSVDDLSRYIDQKTGKAPEPQPQPAPQETTKQPWIRKARRSF